mmetsp:Transcript_27991/g.64606  ORF Transcript_27991/g.64606 Transcript_27991/m.64606 type:complete len:218 (+) Transcript_27991:30-683(+)
MCWVGGKKGRAGGNPNGICRASGDLPGDIPTGASHSRSLTAVLMGSASAGQKPLAPWQTSGLPGMPGPQSRLSKNMGDKHKHVDVTELPSYIKVGARLTYRSQSSGKLMEVIVEMISQSNSEVEIRFAENESVWKMLPFYVLISAGSPLLGPWEDSRVGLTSAPSAAPSQVIVEDDAPANGPPTAAQHAGREVTVLDDDENADEKRSRSPKRELKPT